MSIAELLADSLTRNADLMTRTLADFTEQEMYVRPAGGANHAGWQLGHLCISETGLVSSVGPGIMPPLPEGFGDRYARSRASSDDAASFGMTRQQLLDIFARTRAGTVNWVKTLSDADLTKPSPERIRSWLPTIAHLVVMQEWHCTMHMGQMQVIRRKLGKPMLM